MELTSQHDISAPREQVFAILADPAVFERRLAAARVQVRRQGADHEWELRFHLRGAERRIHLTRTACEAPTHLAFAGRSPRFAIANLIELAPGGPQATRMTVTLTIRPRGMAARLALQSLRLGRRRMQRRFDTAVARLAAELAAP